LSKEFRDLIFSCRLTSELLRNQQKILFPKEIKT